MTTREMPPTKTTMEKLLVQIFERKRWIVDQVKQQSDLYDEYLASTCLIHGIRPPSWLLSATAAFQGARSADFKELKKEDLISGLLFPPPRSNHPSTTTGHNTLYNRPFFPENKLQDSGALFTGTSASEKCCDVGNCSMLVSNCRINNNKPGIRSSIEAVPELNHANTSPPAQTEASMSETNFQLDKSLAKIQRSRSRQKALKLRNSEDAKPERQPTEENHSFTVSGRITRSRTSSGQSTHVRVLLEHPNFSNTTNRDSCGITQSRSGTQKLNSVDKPLQPSNSVGEDVLHNSLDSQALFERSTLAQKDNPMGGNTEEPPSKGDMTEECRDGIRMSQTTPVNFAKGVLQPEKSEEVLSGRVTCSRSTSSNICSQSDTQSNTLEGHDLLQASDAQMIAVQGDDGNDAVQLEMCNIEVADNDFVASLPDEACCNRLGTNMVASFGVAPFSVLNPPPDDDIFVEPKQLFFDEVEDCSLNKGFSPHSEKEKRNGSPDKVRPLGPTESLIVNQETVESLKNFALLNNTCKESGFSIDAALQERGCTLEVVDREEERSASPKFCEKARLELIGGGTECHFHPALSSGKKHGLSLRDQDTGYVGAADADTRSVLTQTGTPESAQTSSTRREIPYLLRSYSKHDINDSFTKSDENSFESDSIKSKMKMIINNALESSWPPYKRRKIEGRSSNVFTTSPRLVVKPLHQIDENGISKFHKNSEDGLKTDQEFKHFTSSSDVEAAHPDISERPGAGLCWSAKRRKTEKYGPSPRLQSKEGDLDMKSGEKDINFSLGSEQTGVETSLDSSLNKEECENAQDCLLGLTDISITQLASEEHLNMPIPESKLNLQKMEEMDSTEGILQDTEPVIGEQLLSYCSVRSPNVEELDPIAGSEYMPELEGFSIGLPAEQMQSFSGDGISVGNIDLPTTTSERISVLVKLCRSTSMLTPLTQSSKHKIYRTPDVYQSLPNGLLERMDLRNVFPFSDEDFRQLKASYDYTDSKPDCAVYSGCMPSSGVQPDHGVVRPPHTPPPDRILGQRIASVPVRRSFEKQQNVNPELTCFRIDEDASPSEEDGNLDEVIDVFHEDISPRDSNSSSRRRPLVDLTNNKTLPLPSASVTKNDRGSLDSVNTELHIHGTQINAKQKLRKTCGRDRRAMKDKKNQSSSIISGNSVGKTSESLYNMSPKLSRKASEGHKSRSFLTKGSKRANIVSSVSSFIPHVQQKQQPATLATGKRDVKVKALEAAEAAKRLEEKRENDRKMKKEVAKLERARLEEEKIKHLELEQKKKEEERKKKEADVAARKRLREEKDRKEKEKKRKCIEEARRQQKEQEKFRAEKEEKEHRRRAADEREGKSKDLLNEEQKHQKAEKRSQIAECRKKRETGTKVAAEDAKKVRSSICEANRCGFSFIEESGDPSYEISPYQVSDDEEEEEQDVIPNQKFIPSWAREKYLASIVPSMQQIDPCEIFRLTRVCDISPVILPRMKLK